MEKREPSCTVGGNMNGYSHYGEQYRDFLKKTKTKTKTLGIKLPYDPAIPLSGIYPEKTTILKDTCFPMFIAALFTIARTWKQCRCPPTDEWLKKLWYIHKMEYYSAIQRNEFKSVLVRWLNLEPVVQNEVGQKERNKY